MYSLNNASITANVICITCRKQVRVGLFFWLTQIVVLSNFVKRLHTFLSGSFVILSFHLCLVVVVVVVAAAAAAAVVGWLAKVIGSTGMTTKRVGLIVGRCSVTQCFNIANYRIVIGTHTGSRYLRFQLRQDVQLSQRDRAAECVIVLAKSRRLELGDNILRIL